MFDFFMLDFFFGLFSNDLGIDLGTANTLVLVAGKGIVIREPSVVAIHRKSKDIIAVGSEAKKMLGKTPGNILAIRPLRDGVISDFYTAAQMLNYFIHKVHETPSFIPKIPRPRVVIGIPSGVTEVERRAVSEAVIAAGARKVYLVEQPIAAAIGSGILIEEPKGALIVDSGGGTTEIAVISLSGIVTSRSLRVAGDRLDNAIVEYAKERYNLLLGERTAEDIKIAIGSAIELENEKDLPQNAVMRGRDLATGLPRSIEVTRAEIRAALESALSIISEAIKDTVEATPPELVSDIIKDGITLAGGTSLVHGLAELIEKETGIKTKVAHDPLTCVVRGAGVLLEDFKLLENVAFPS